MACATAAAVNGAIAEGAIFEAAKGKEGITEVLKSAVVDPPVGGKRTRMATRALHRGEDDGSGRRPAASETERVIAPTTAAEA